MKAQAIHCVVDLGSYYRNLSILHSSCQSQGRGRGRGRDVQPVYRGGYPQLKLRQRKDSFSSPDSSPPPAPPQKVIEYAWTDAHNVLFRDKIFNKDLAIHFKRQVTTEVRLKVCMYIYIWVIAKVELIFRTSLLGKLWCTLWIAKGPLRFVMLNER